MHNNSSAVPVTAGTTIDADFNAVSAACAGMASATAADVDSTLLSVDDSQLSSREGRSDSVDSCLSGTSF